MPALNSVVTAFLTRVKADLNGPPGVNFVKAQDIANVLRLLGSAASIGTVLDADISEIMHGKNPSTEQNIGEFVNIKPVVSGFTKLIAFASGTMPVNTLFTSVATLYNTDVSTTTVVKVSLRGEMLADQFRGMTLTVDTTPAKIITHDALGYFTLDRAIAAVAGGEAVTVTTGLDLFNSPRPTEYAGGQPAHNAFLANVIAVAQAAVIAIP